MCEVVEVEVVVGRGWVGVEGNWTLLYANSQFMVAIRKETPRPERLCFNRHADRAGPVYGWFSFSSYYYFFLLLPFYISVVSSSFRMYGPTAVWRCRVVS